MTTALERLRQTQPQAELSADVKRAHVLLVDDDPNVLRLCHRHLDDAAVGPAGIEVVYHDVLRGEQTIETARRLRDGGDKIAAALLDIVLPGAWDGIEACLRLWEIDRDVQCILMTGAGRSVEEAIEERVPAELLPKCDYLGKPFTRFSLVQHLRRAIHAWCAQVREEIRRGENIKLVLQLGQLIDELGGPDDADASEGDA